MYNWALRQKTDAYYQEKKRLSYKDLSEALTLLKQQDAYCWLSEVSSVPLQQALRHLDKAFLNFFEGRAKYPTFKKKRNRQSATYTSNAFKWDGTHLTLAKMTKPLDIHWSRPLPDGAKPSSVTLTIAYADSTTSKPDVTQHTRPGCFAICSDTQLDTQYDLHWFTMVDIDGQ